MSKAIITTPRLILRQWQTSDYDLFVQMCRDKDVMQFFPSTLTKDETVPLIKNILAHFAEYGYGAYAAERTDNNKFIGFIGFSHPTFKADFTPCIEIAWRLSKENWNQGFATEGAKACLDYGFSELKFKEVYSFTSKLNLPSIRVMQKIGMIEAGEFEHPNLPAGHKLSTHVLYKT
jgi:ribosomal-protein-alanine N-acetyltransferase